MPKVSDQHKQRRRQEVLDGARRCFGRHGYEGATVARLEEETGLSRGAIFNYFPSKEALFADLAVESSNRLTEIWLNEGYRALLEAIVQEDADWFSVQLEATRRVRTDPEFRRQIEAREAEAAARSSERLARIRPNVRDDVPLEATAVFLGLVANGLALRQSVGDTPPDLDTLVELVETGVRPRGRR